ncbi:MAG: protease 2 [candidate division Zixibacteria bacterium SM23_73_3]|nr:MAG: protease 2 [candidate division Zixibacteria bacterium SM23_73_3]
MVVSCNHQVEVKPPVAKIEPKVDTLFGQQMVDDYYWLRERGNPEVIDYLKAENAYTEAVMRNTQKLQDKLYEEMVSRIKETDLSVPVKRDDYYYYSRTEEGKQYKTYCRKRGSLEAEEEILLDVNQLAEGKEYMYLGVHEVSPDHRLLAYAVDTTGSERYTLRVKDLETGELHPDVIDSVSTSLEWANDNKTFFYTITDEAWRPFKLYRHTLGGDIENDVLLFHEKDDAFSLDIAKSKSMGYLYANLESMTTSEVHYLDANNPTGKFKLVHSRQQDLEYSLYHHGDQFYIVTNDNAKNFKLMQAPLSDPSKKNWREVIPHRDSVKLDRIEIFRDFMVLYERENGLKEIKIKDFATGEIHRVEFPEPVYTYWPGWNPDYKSQLLRFTYTSFVTPNSVYDYNMKTRERELKKRKEVLGGYDPDEYESERIFATASDGARIPISMVYRKGINKDGNNPLYLNGYGAYGASVDPYFSSNRLSILDRGFIYARAHVRGGGEMGRHWYDDGKLLNKKNTFTDFVTVAEHLIGKKYTSSDRLVISGGSAGGLLIGAVVNMRPDLFRVVIADVPFVDLINTMLDPSIPLTVIEYEEWGDPNEKEYYDYMLSYSPYDNVEAKDYPNMLILAGLNDTRVQYWEPAKWTAKLRATKTDDNRLLLKTNMGTGHGGASGRYDRLKEIAFEYAFMFDVLGMKE